MLLGNICCQVRHGRDKCKSLEGKNTKNPEGFYSQIASQLPLISHSILRKLKLDITDNLWNSTSGNSKLGYNSVCCHPFHGREELGQFTRNLPSSCEIPRCWGHFKVLKLNRYVTKLAGDTRDVGLIPGLERSPRVGNDNPLQYSCLEIPWTEEPGVQRVGCDWVTKHTHTSFIKPI